MDTLIKVSDFIYRGKCCTEEEVIKWIHAYEKESATSWRVKSALKNSHRFTYRKTFLCHHGGFQRVKKECNKKGKSKNTQCRAEIVITIKKKTKDIEKKDPHVKAGYPTIFQFKNEHNHTVNTAEAGSFLRPRDEIRSTFVSYFNDGMTIKESINYHESKLQLQFGVDSREFANAGINPQYRTVLHWYNDWRKVNLGPRFGCGSIEKLQEKRELYKKDGIIVEYEETPYAVVIITNLMQRAHMLNFSKDVVFVDSSASCDAAGHSITFMLTPCAIGAVPLAVLITKGQSEEDYKAAFALLKNNLENSFGGQGYPKTIITDDSAAERNALNFVWPQSKLFLCKFHILQSVWRWLFEKIHNIEADDRRMLYTSFRNILMATNIENASKFYSIATGFLPQNNNSELTIKTIQTIKKYPQWIGYVESYWERKEEWCLAYRDTTTHGHQTNNFAEITVRLFKDIVLSRNKAYNVIALIDFTVTCMEEYYQKRIINFANSRNSNPRLLLKNLLKNTSNIKKEDILYLGEKLYKVPSATTQGEFYVVDGNFGSCTCYIGRFGRFCKHQATVYFYYDKQVINAPAVTTESRYLMAKLALGENAPPISFYMPLLDSEIPTHNQGEPNLSSIPSNELENVPANTKVLKEHDNNKTGNDDIQEIFLLMKQHHINFGTSLSTKQKVIQRLRSIKTQTSWESFLCTAGSRLPLRLKTNLNIKVQPTSISRRKAGVTRGSKRLPSGRPAKGEPSTKKRKRNLAENVSKNRPNAKSH